MKRLFVSCLAALLTAGFVGEALAQFDGRDRDRDNDRGRRSEVLGVVYGASDSCDTGRVVTIVNTLTNCDSLGSERSWSIKVGGQCRDISDTTADKACTAIKTRNAPNVVYGATDSCDESKVIAAVGLRTDCRSLPSERSWSVKINGQCRDISDTDAPRACLGVQSELVQ